jgi:hypothetical protein
VLVQQAVCDGLDVIIAFLWIRSLDAFYAENMGNAPVLMKCFGGDGPGPAQERPVTPMIAVQGLRRGVS